MKASTQQWLDLAKADLLNCVKCKPTQQEAREFYESAKNIFEAIANLID
jgi:hypothetical protein